MNEGKTHVSTSTHNVLYKCCDLTADKLFLKGYAIADSWLGHDMMELVLGKLKRPTKPLVLEPTSKRFK